MRAIFCIIASLLLMPEIAAAQADTNYIMHQVPQTNINVMILYKYDQDRAIREELLQDLSKDFIYIQAHAPQLYKLAAKTKVWVSDNVRKQFNNEAGHYIGCPHSKGPEGSVILNSFMQQAAPNPNELDCTMRWVKNKNTEVVKSHFGVEIQEDEYFEMNKMSTAPILLIHELAHGYDYENYDYRNKKILDAYNAAMASGKYQNLYASTNAREYFAENTVAYFSHHLYPPYTREDLKEYDPTGYNLMVEIWGNGS